VTHMARSIMQDKVAVAIVAAIVLLVLFGIAVAAWPSPHAVTVQHTYPAPPWHVWAT
jgi:hypothetical protein